MISSTNYDFKSGQKLLQMNNRQDLDPRWVSLTHNGCFEVPTSAFESKCLVTLDVDADLGCCLEMLRRTKRCKIKCFCSRMIKVVESQDYVQRLSLFVNKSVQSKFLIFLSDVKINTSELVIFTVINFQLLTLVKINLLFIVK